MIQYLGNAILCGQRVGDPAIMKRLNEAHDRFHPFVKLLNSGDFNVPGTLKNMGVTMLCELCGDVLFMTLGVYPMTEVEILDMFHGVDMEGPWYKLNQSIFNAEPNIRDLIYYCMGFDVKLQFVEVKGDVQRDDKRVSEVNMLDHSVYPGVMCWLNRFKWHTGSPKPIEALFTTGYCEDFASMLQARFGGEVVPVCNGNHYVLDLDGVLYDVHGPIYKADDALEC